MTFVNGTVEYFGINLNELLNANTVKTQNFTVTPLGALAPVGVKSANYLPRKGQIKLYLEESVAASAMPCRVTASGLQTVEGNELSLDLNVYMQEENYCPLYEVSVAGVTCLATDGKPLYSVPQSGECTVCVRVVNPTSETQNVVLSFYATENGEETEPKAQETMTLEAGESRLLRKKITAKQGQVIDVGLEKAK